MMMGVVFFQYKGLESNKMKNINLLIQIDIMFLKRTIEEIQECVGNIQEENKGQQVMLIQTVHHILIMTDRHSSDSIPMMQ